MREIIYTCGTPVINEPYTHRLVGHILAAAANRGYAIRLKVPDAPEALEGTLLMRLPSGDGAIRVRVEPRRSQLPVALPGSLLLFGGSLDYWRLAVQTPRKVRSYSKVYWVQGLESEESYLKHNSLKRRLALAFTESLAMRACRAIICPSDAMIETLIRRYPFLRRSNFVTIPNLADPGRGPARDSSLWGFEEAPRFALGYAGGLSRWQCFEETCRIVAEAQNQIPEMWFLVLTRDKEKAEIVLRGVGVKRYRIRSTTTDQVARYVASFDLGFMLRRDHVVNRVACPTKWLEYWQCGVPLVTTRAVRIVAEAPGTEFNCVVDLDDVQNAAKRIVAYASHPETERQRIRAEVVRCVDRSWSWAQGMRAVEDVFDTIETCSGGHHYFWKDRLAAVQSVDLRQKG